jgi:hypothetical protein
MVYQVVCVSKIMEKLLSTKLPCGVILVYYMKVKIRWGGEGRYGIGNGGLMLRKCHQGSLLLKFEGCDVS